MFRVFVIKNFAVQYIMTDTKLLTLSRQELRQLSIAGDLKQKGLAVEKERLKAAEQVRTLNACIQDATDKGDTSCNLWIPKTDQKHLQPFLDKIDCTVETAGFGEMLSITLTW